MLLEEKRKKEESLAYPKWKRIGLASMEREITQAQGRVTVENRESWEEKDISIHQISSGHTDLKDCLYTPFESDLSKFDTYAYGSNEKYVLEAETKFQNGFAIRIPKATVIEEPLVLNYSLNKDNKDLIEQHVIVAEESSQATIVINYRSEEDLEGYHNGLTRIVAKEDAKLKIVFIQTFGAQVHHINNVLSLIDRQSQVDYVCFDLGAKVVASDYTTYLLGDGSINNTVTAYLGKDDQKLDLGYNAYHYGKYSESLIEAKGALMDRSKKVFRGNLKFERGSKKSKGSESEYVLLLDKSVHSDAIPALLCDEDDVNGEHAASAGQINQEQLFYLMSRGFSMKEAKKLIIHGSFTQVIDLLPKGELQEEIEEILERRL